MIGHQHVPNDPEAQLGPQIIPSSGQCLGLFAVAALGACPDRERRTWILNGFRRSLSGQAPSAATADCDTTEFW